MLGKEADLLLPRDECCTSLSNMAGPFALLWASDWHAHLCKPLLPRLSAMTKVNMVFLWCTDPCAFGTRHPFHLRGNAAMLALPCLGIDPKLPVDYLRKGED